MLFEDQATALCAYPSCDQPVHVLRNSYCVQHRGAHRQNARKDRRSRHELRFVGIDGEGVGGPEEHKYVLLSVGEDSVTWPDGPGHISEIFEFLYTCFTKDRKAVYCGFYLGYDFNMWLKMLPRERVWRLLIAEGVATRQRKKRIAGMPPFPVRYQGWEFDMLGGDRRFKLRPEGVTGKDSWLWINDAGPFFQSSLLNAINPADWPEPIVTEDEYAILEKGKARRSSAELDQEMITYNVLENRILARLLTHYNAGLTSVDVRLHKTQWFGPGQAAQAWIQLSGSLEKPTEAVRNYPEPLHDALVGSYYGGRFEICAHGHAGTIWEYDINSAYPAVIAGLPCPCGPWEHVTGKLPPFGSLALLHCRTRGYSNFLGGLPFRTPTGATLHPRDTAGWYFYDEVCAAYMARLIDDIEPLEYWLYHPCEHENPAASIADLYADRLRVGKNTPEGKARKLVYNSVYGKFGQSVGMPKYGNALYASLITAGCRAQILRAIATHPGQASACVMIATDGVYFTSPHPDLPVSDRLGEWDCEKHENLTLFKPGVYWGDKARKRIANGEAVAFKSRGVNARDLAPHLAAIDDMFAAWVPGRKGEQFRTGPFPDVRNAWPSVTLIAQFGQRSILQALRETEKRHYLYKAKAAEIRENFTVIQNSDPYTKRGSMSLTRQEDGIWRTHPYTHFSADPHMESTPYSSTFGYTGPRDLTGWVTQDGPIMNTFKDALGTGG